MWVNITAADGDALTGTLDNIPSDTPQLKAGDVVRFMRSDVIDLIFGEDRTTRPPPPTDRREYWDRCRVDRCVIDKGMKVHYLYREAPEPPGRDDKYPDSGWRIRGDYRGIDDAALDERKTSYLALGVVLNCDDSWLRLIDEPIGSEFIRDWATDTFDACEE